MHCIIVAKAREYPISFQPSSYSISNKALLGYWRYKSKLKARVSTAKYIVCTRAIALLFAVLQRNTTLYSFFLGRKIIDTLCVVVVAQSLIIPLFTKGHLYTVFLQKVENTVSELCIFLQGMCNASNQYRLRMIIVHTLLMHPQVSVLLLHYFHASNTA